MNIKEIKYPGGTVLSFTDGPIVTFEVKHTDTTNPAVIRTPLQVMYPNNIQDTDPCSACSNRGRGPCLCTLPNIANPTCWW